MTWSRFRLPSISFSGAGFLGAYHGGVYASLLKHNHLLQPMERISNEDNSTRPPILTGVSAGSLIAAAISAGVIPDDAMSVVLTVSKRTKDKGGIFDVLRPGFSLIDELEDLLIIEMQKALGGSSSVPGESSIDNYDNELLLNRIQNGYLLRIGMTDRRTMDPTAIKRDLNSYLYADRYRNMKDIISACTLSSYIPIFTGPLLGKDDSNNLAIYRAWKGVQEMENLGFLKHGVTGLPISSKHETQEGIGKLHYIDGGLVNMFPEITKSTVIVSPINGSYVDPYIAPEHTQSDFQHKLSELTSQLKLSMPFQVDISDRVKIGANIQNLLALYRMSHSSSPDVLQEQFKSGYDDSERFLKEHDLLTKYSA